MGEYNVAQTNLQLYAQLHQADWTASELFAIKSAYELATYHFAGLLRPSGKCFIAHLVGTASLTVISGGDKDATIAALLHSIRLKGVRLIGYRLPLMRARFPATVNVEAREIISKYEQVHRKLQRSDHKTLKSAELDSIERSAVLIHLANEIEEIIDGSALLSSSWKQQTSYVTQLRTLAKEVDAGALLDVIEASQSRIEKLNFPDSLGGEQRSSYRARRFVS